MLFSELYSAYYNAVAGIIKALQKGERSEKKLSEIVSQHAFGESFMTVLPSLKNGKWQLVGKDMTPTIQHPPTMPLTLLQKRWLKSVLSDERIKLFGIDLPEFSDVEPLFTKDDYYIYDKYLDGDNYSDEGYIQRFRIILRAVHQRLPIHITMTGRNGKPIKATCIPDYLEYSEKDDKFRLITRGNRFITTVNLGRITDCTIASETSFPLNNVKKEYDTFTLLIKDQRNALERCMLHFAHFEKTAERVDEDTYRLCVKYDKEDAAELVIRVLSFGPMVEVTEPQSFRNLIKEKLKKQRDCGLF